MASHTTSGGITLAVLAGGAGTRMGRPKAWLELSGRPILEHLADRLDWRDGPSLLVTAPGYERPPGRERFTSEVTDPAPGQGPLRGVLTALEHCNSEVLLIVTVDMPSIRPTHLAWLASTLRARPQTLGVLPVRRDGTEERVEPFPCALQREAHPAVAAQAAAGIWSVQGLLSVSGFARAAVPSDWDAQVWTNLNRPSDVTSFVARPST